jgi:hypothetical protein
MSQMVTQQSASKSALLEVLLRVKHPQLTIQQQNKK